MKKVSTFLFNRIIVFLMISLIGFFASCSGAGSAQINEPYHYSVKPGSEEWGKLDSIEKKKKACRVPVRQMEKMTTEALVETIMTYPFITNVNSYIKGMGLDNDYEKKIKEAFYLLGDDFQGVEILKSRSDAVEEIERYMQDNDLKEGYDLFFVGKKITEYLMMR